jgi:Uma2 family endonuclease
MALTPEPPAVSMSVEAWLLLGEDEPGELVQGRWVEEEVPDATHEVLVAWLIWRFREWLGGRGLVLGSDLKILVANNTGRKADVVVYLDERRLPPRRGPVTVAPNVLIEVVSPSPRDERRDRVEKMSEYALFGVDYYWLVDATLGTVEIFELDAGRYAKVVGVTGGTVTDVPGCPGLELDVDALWRELSKLSGP